MTELGPAEELQRDDLFDSDRSPLEVPLWVWCLCLAIWGAGALVWWGI